jgi:hypothetical protein
MLICPVCRSQNMDTAKFCGNCGNPFPRPSEPTSSLINCPQGHVYSAIYQHCPYCPQPESDDASSFITRVEEQVTAVDPSSGVSTLPQSPPIDFSTRVEAPDTLFEATESPAATYSTMEAPPSGFSQTEVINSVPTFETIVDNTNSIETILEEPAAFSVNSQLSDTVVMPPVEPVKPNLTSMPSQTTTNQSEQSTVQATAASSAPDQDRRTIVMADQTGPARVTRGKIVGWLITYNRNPDGDDHRVYAGYNRLGANPVCDILIDDETVSGSHAIIVYREGRCLIKDDLSRNGTFVNGREITEAYPLQNYDQIRIGNTYLTFVSAQQIS